MNDRPTPSEPRRPGYLARALFATMDLTYGRTPTLEKFAALELVARVPYQAWENVAYVAMTHVHRRLGFARRIFEFMSEARDAQDNEQWHLLIVEELLARRGARRPWLLASAIPQLLALFYYHVSWLLYVIAPRLSYALNAEFENHAEHEYLSYVTAHPELEVEPWVSAFAADYGNHATVADLLRQIASDEAAHRDESLAHIAEPRFAEAT
jgi:ubiquinol oxidase